MSCNGNCNQGRKCTCGEDGVNDLGWLLIAVIIAIALIGAAVALLYAWIPNFEDLLV